jgi:hypothetical protein
MPQPPKDQASGDPMPTVKQAPKNAPLAKDKGDANGPEQDGPEANAKDAAQPPMPGVKGNKSNDPDSSDAQPKQMPPQQAKDAAQPRGNDADKGVEWDQLAKLVEKVGKKDENSDAAGKELADIAKNSDDPRKRDIAKDVLDKNNREPDTGKEKKKGPNLAGTNGVSKGISDDIKADAANREFTRRIGQMQLDDWKKRITPEVLKKAGMSQADFERFVKDLQAYDALVQKRNADLLRNQLQSLRGNSASGTGLRVVEGPEGSRNPLDRRSAPPPPELRDVQRRFTTNP